MAGVKYTFLEKYMKRNVERKVMLLMLGFIWKGQGNFKYTGHNCHNEQNTLEVASQELQLSLMSPVGGSIGYSWLLVEKRSDRLTNATAKVKEELKVILMQSPQPHRKMI